MAEKNTRGEKKKGRAKRKVEFAPPLRVTSKNSVPLSAAAAAAATIDWLVGQ